MQKIIDDVLVIDETKISIKYYIENRDLPFNRKLLEKKIKEVFSSDSLDILTINNIDVSLELFHYPAKDVVDSIYTMDDIKIQVTFKNQKIILFYINQITL